MSLRSIAQELGISATAVSLALRNSPRVSLKLRERIRRLAKARGHVPNARLTELMREVRRCAEPAYRGTIGVISLFPEERPWIERPSYSHLGEFVRGAQQRAAEHGYNFEHFWVKRPGLTATRLRTILEARGIFGLLCLGSLDPEERLPVALRRFAIVTFAASIPDRLHRVVSHFAGDARRVFDELLRRGYRRPGLLIAPSADRRTDHLYTATFLSHQERYFAAPAIPILRGETWDEPSFAAWYARHCPDALVFHHPPDYVATALASLAKQRVSAPRDVGVALLDKITDPKFAGIRQDPGLMGAVAAEMLMGRLLLQDFGPPEFPKVELVLGHWNEGSTLTSAVLRGGPQRRGGAARARGTESSARLNRVRVA